MALRNAFRARNATAANSNAALTKIAEGHLAIGARGKLVTPSQVEKRKAQRQSGVGERCD